MASRWYYQSKGQQRGPVGFRQLAAWVREGRITPADLVRPQWSDEWQRAESVIGLFHAADRLQLQQPVEGTDAPPPSAPATEDLGASVPLTAADAEPSADRNELIGDEVPVEAPPSWVRRFMEVVGRRRGRGPLYGSGDAKFDPQQDSRLAGAIERALASVESRSQPSRRGRLAAFIAGRFSARGLRSAFRWGAALAAGNAAALAILQWSETEAQRFPGRAAAAGIRQFPIWGECDSSEYALLLVNVMLAAGILGYLLAQRLELWTDN